MEHVEGRPLSGLILRGGLPADSVARYGSQIADALEYAHAHGIIHRDLKPANVVITPEGRAKVLDFGLAQRAWHQGAEFSETIPLTQPGTVAGTIAYMAPEVLRGGRADARSDIWALGVMLHEMSTGVVPFAGRTDFELSSNILRELPSELPPRVPALCRSVILRCLAKDPEQRYQRVGDMRAELQAISSAAAGPVPATVGERHKGRARAVRSLAVIALLLLVALVISWRLWQQDYFWQNPLADAKVERLTDFEGTETDAAISPDGRLVVFLADRDGPFDTWISQIGSGESVNITKGRLPGAAPNLGVIRAGGFSGDGSQIWIRRTPRPQYFVTWLMPAMGGAPRLFLAPGTEPVWSPDGSKIGYFNGFEPGDPIRVADRNGRNPHQVFTEKPGGHCHFLTWSPDGRFIYFTRGVIATEEFDIWRIRIAANGSPCQPERITYHNARVAYLAWLDARTLIYSATAADGSGQWLYAIDVEHRIPHRVSSGVTEQYLSVAVSDTRPHRLVATVANSSASLWTVPVTDRVQPEAAASPLPTPNARALGPRFASDSLLFLSSKGGSDGLWKLENGAALELWKGSEGGVVAPPAISPDGSQICFSYRNQGRVGLYLMNANGANTRALAESLNVRGAPSWSPDGKWIAVAANEGEGTRIFKIPVNGGPPVRLLDTSAYGPVWSPDGRFILYFESLEGGATPIKAIKPDKGLFPVPDIRINYRGSPFRFVPKRQAIIFLKEEITTSGLNFYLADLETGQQRQLTDLKQGHQIQAFDISPDGKQLVFDRVRQNSDIVLMELAR